MQAVDLALVRQKLDDDDGGRKGERDSHIERCERIQPQGEPDQEAENRCERHLTEPCDQCHRPQRPHQFEIQFEPDKEEQHCDAKFGEQVNLRV